MAVDYFLKLDGIQGESVNTAHKDEIQLETFGWGAVQISSVSGTGGSGAGKASLHDLTIVAALDKSTPKFFKSLCEGTHIKTGTLTAIKAGADNKPYLKVDFTELFVTQLAVGAGSEVPSVNVSFSYNTIKIDYSVQNELGNLTSTGPVSYDVKQSKVS